MPSSIALQDTASNKPQQHPLSQRHTEHESGKCIVFLKEAKIRRYIKKKYRQGPALAVVIYENIGPRLYPGTKSNITTTKPTSGFAFKPYPWTIPRYGFGAASPTPPFCNRSPQVALLQVKRNLVVSSGSADHQNRSSPTR